MEGTFNRRERSKRRGHPKLSNREIRRIRERKPNLLTRMEFCAHIRNFAKNAEFSDMALRREMS